MRNGDLRLLSAGITRNIHLEAENGALREFVEQLQSRVGELLISINPPEQGWDASGNHIFSNMGEPGSWSGRAIELRALCGANEMAVSEPGTASHYTHRAGLLSSTVEGRAVRALCGVYFVPTQDHEKLPQCDTCATRYSKLPEDV